MPHFLPIGTAEDSSAGHSPGQEFPMEDLPFPKKAGVLLTGLFTLGVENESHLVWKTKKNPASGNRFAAGNSVSGYSCVEPLSGTCICFRGMIAKGKGQGQCSSFDKRDRCCSLGNEVPPGEVSRYMETFDFPNPGGKPEGSRQR